MKTLKRIIAAAAVGVVLSVLCPGNAKAQSKDYDGTFLPESFVTDREKPTLVMLTATWCPPCNTMKKGVMKEEDVEKVLSSMNVVLLDVDTADGKKLAPGFRGAGFEGGIPFFCILDKNGVPVKSLIGSTSKGNFLKFLSFASKEE